MFDQGHQVGTPQAGRECQERTPEVGCPARERASKHWFYFYCNSAQKTNIERTQVELPLTGCYYNSAQKTNVERTQVEIPLFWISLLDCGTKDNLT